MPRMLKVFSIAIVLFAVAAGVSWYLQGQQHVQTGEHEEKTPKAAADHAHGKEVKMEAPSTRPLMRSPSSPEADRLTRMAETLQAQQESLKGREKLVADREKQLDLIHDEIKKDQKKLDGVRKEVETELALVQEKLEFLEKRAGDTEKDRQKADVQLEEIRRTTLEIGGVESKNLKQLASIYDKMETEPAAQGILQMAEKGKLDTAVTILAFMRDRQAANILGEISKQDATVAVQLFDRMRFIKTGTNSGKGP